MGMHKIQSIDLTASQPSVTFAAIPQTYKTLVLKVSARVTSASFAQIWAAINGSTSGQSLRFLQGDGTSASSGTYGYIDGGLSDGTGQTANTFGNSEMTIPNYASAASAKAVSTDRAAENNATAAILSLTASLASALAAIASLTLSDSGGGSFAAGSSFTLYGID